MDKSAKKFWKRKKREEKLAARRGPAHANPYKAAPEKDFSVGRFRLYIIGVIVLIVSALVVWKMST